MIKRTIRDGVEVFHAYCVQETESLLKLGEFASREEAAARVQRECAELAGRLAHRVSCAEVLFNGEAEHLVGVEIANAYWMARALEATLSNDRTVQETMFCALEHLGGEQALRYADLVGEQVHVYSYNTRGDYAVDEWLSPAEARAKYPEIVTNAWRDTRAPSKLGVLVEAHAPRDLVPPMPEQEAAA